MKTCRVCRQELPFDAFSPRGDRGQHQKRRSICRQCHSAAMLRRYHEDTRPARDRLLRKYGLTLEAYDALLAAQNGGCAICGGTNPSGHALHVDHDHDTGQVRGLLCRGCNTGLGGFRDNPRLVAAALSYLDAFASKIFCPKSESHACHSPNTRRSAE